MGSGRSDSWARADRARDPGELDALVTDGRWDGPLIVSMPRTGSTLLGAIMLLATDGEGGRAFDRYVHEPVAPLFWDGAPLTGLRGLVGELSDRDVVQESAYQFTSAEIAWWFVTKARRPVAFTTRDPRLAWPSRWRLLFREWIEADPHDRDASVIRHALHEDDFSAAGDLLTRRVPQPDNGWLAFREIMARCDAEDVEMTVVDSGRLREDPTTVISGLCAAWGAEHHHGMERWADLSAVLPRIVMSDLARREYRWYYAGTLGGRGGIQPERRTPLALDRFPPELRGSGVDPLTIDTALAWHEEVLRRPEVL